VVIIAAFYDESNPAEASPAPAGLVCDLYDSRPTKGESRHLRPVLPLVTLKRRASAAAWGPATTPFRRGVLDPQLPFIVLLWNKHTAPAGGRLV
jgi:hypothetical protein